MNNDHSRALFTEELPRFREWVQQQGYVSRDVPATAQWEIERYELYDPAGLGPMVFIYKKKSGELTAYAQEPSVFEGWLNDVVAA